MKTAGIDTSFTGTGFAIKDDSLSKEKQFTWKTIKTKPEDFKDDTDRIIHIRNEIIKSIPSDTDKVFIEDVFVGHGPSAGASLRLALLAGCVRAGLRDAGIKFDIVQPKMVKKHLTGNGNAQKDMMIMTVYKRFGIEVSNNNEADACALADMGCSGFVVVETVKVKKVKKSKKEE